VSRILNIAIIFIQWSIPTAWYTPLKGKCTPRLAFSGTIYDIEVNLAEKNMSKFQEKDAVKKDSPGH
jgi:hypothetical protein